MNETVDYDKSFYSKWLMRRVAPIAVLIYGSALMFFLTNQYFSTSSKLSTTEVNMVKPNLVKLDVSKSGVYSFAVVQALDSKTIPNYSELDIEILDKDYGHVYSFYKTLWVEKHPNGNGGESVYSDTKMDFQLYFENAGDYYLRAVSLNGKESMVKANVYSVKDGSRYFRNFQNFFLLLSVVLVLGTPIWGNPIRMLSSLKKIKSLRYNDLFWLLAILIGLVYLTLLISSVWHIGYPSAGDDYNRLPGYFFDKKNVLYIG